MAEEYDYNYNHNNENEDNNAHDEIDNPVDNYENEFSGSKISNTDKTNQNSINKNDNTNLINLFFRLTSS